MEHTGLATSLTEPAVLTSVPGLGVDLQGFQQGDSDLHRRLHGGLLLENAPATFSNPICLRPGYFGEAANGSEGRHKLQDTGFLVLVLESPSIL